MDCVTPGSDLMRRPFLTETERPHRSPGMATTPDGVAGEQNPAGGQNRDFEGGTPRPNFAAPEINTPHRSRNAMSSSGNFYARNRRDTKTKQPISAPPPARHRRRRRPRTRPRPRQPRRIRARSTIGPTATWPTAATSRPRGPPTVVRWPTTRPGVVAADPQHPSACHQSSP